MSEEVISISSSLESKHESQNCLNKVDLKIINNTIELTRPFKKLNAEWEEKKLTITSSSELASKPEGLL